MSVTVSYNTLVTQLEKELTITVTVREEPERFKRKLSQAKHRQAIEGKLIFSVEPSIIPGASVISVALAPKKNTVEVIQVDKSQEL